MSNFPTQRIDRRDTDVTLGNHERRIAKLERSLVGSGCKTAAPWGPTDLVISASLDFCPPSCCTFDITDPEGSVNGIVWSDCDVDVFDPTQVVFGQMISGQVRVVIDDPGFFTIEADCLDEGDPDFPDHVFSYFYSITPPWFTRTGEGPIDMPTFGYGTARQKTTGLTVPAYITSLAWGILIPGVDQPFTDEHLILAPPANWARPATSYSPAYPWDWANGDTLFEGTFTFFYGGLQDG